MARAISACRHYPSGARVSARWKFFFPKTASEIASFPNRGTHSISLLLSRIVIIFHPLFHPRAFKRRRVSKARCRRLHNEQIAFDSMKTKSHPSFPPSSRREIAINYRHTLMLSTRKKKKYEHHPSFLPHFIVPHLPSKREGMLSHLSYTHTQRVSYNIFKKATTPRTHAFNPYR